MHHDAVIPGVGPIAELTVGDLPDWVPLLDLALDVCAGMTVNVEIKNLPTEPGHDPTEAVAAAVAALAAEAAGGTRLIVSSFSLASIDAVRAAEPSVVTGWLTVPAFDQLRALATAREHGHHALHPHHSVVTDELVAEAHAHGLLIATWTVDEPDDVRRVAAAGVDIVITNVPDRAREALAGG